MLFDWESEGICEIESGESGEFNLQDAKRVPLEGPCRLCRESILSLSTLSLLEAVYEPVDSEDQLDAWAETRWRWLGAHLNILGLLKDWSIPAYTSLGNAVDRESFHSNTPECRTVKMPDSIIGLINFESKLNGSQIKAEWKLNRSRIRTKSKPIWSQIEAFRWTHFDRTRTSWTRTNRSDYRKLSHHKVEYAKNLSMPQIWGYHRRSSAPPFRLFPPIGTIGIH